MNKLNPAGILLFATVISFPLFAREYVEYYENPGEHEENRMLYVPYSDIEMEQEAQMAAMASGHVSPEDAVMTSTSTINWTKNIFSSDVSLDVEKAGIPMPSGKSTSVKQIQMKLPVLVKDPLLSIYVDDARNLGDLVLDGTVTLEDLTRIVDSSRQTPAVFASGGGSLLTKHEIDLRNISQTLVKHKVPYTVKQPIDRISSRPYSGIVLDARGSLPVQGEFIESRVYPCLFPKVWTDSMELVYERNMVDAEISRKKGIVHYSASDLPENYSDRVGKDPLWITVKKVFGVNRCDPVISQDDYLRIVSVKENLELIRQGKIVILLDKDLLEHKVSAPEKNKNYYIAYHQMKRYFYENKVPDVVLNPVLSGIQITMQNLRFIADSPELLPEETSRISQIAKSLKKVTADGGFSIMIEGHTADVNKPMGQLDLSIRRAQAIIKALESEGLDESLFSYRGYGGTKPVADNSSPEGRAKNRRVEIIVMPKASYIMTN